MYGLTPLKMRLSLYFSDTKRFLTNATCVQFDTTVNEFVHNCIAVAKTCAMLQEMAVSQDSTTGHQWPLVYCLPPLPQQL